MPPKYKKKKQVIKKLLAIDPGTENLGWAIFNVAGRLHNKGAQLAVREYKYMDSGVFQIKNKSLDWMQRMDLLLIDVQKILQDIPIDVVVIEEPAIFIGTAKGEGANNSGSVLKLTAVVHSIRSMAKRMGCKVHLLGVRKWKGNTKKEDTQRRINRSFGINITQPDQADAVGVGRYFLMNLNK